MDVLLHRVTANMWQKTDCCVHAGQGGTCSTLEYRVAAVATVHIDSQDKMRSGALPTMCMIEDRRWIDNGAAGV